MTYRLRIIKSVLISAAVLLIAGTITVAAGNMPDAGVGAAGTILGDADSDGAVTIDDVTCIQRFLAEWPVSDGFSGTAADADGNGRIEITDVTIIQQWLACMEIPYSIGEQLTEPSIAPTTQFPTDEDGWGREIFRP